MRREANAGPCLEGVRVEDPQPPSAGAAPFPLSYCLLDRLAIFSPYVTHRYILQILQMYASQEILLGSSGGGGSSEPPTTAGQGFGGASAPSPGSSSSSAAGGEGGAAGGGAVPDDAGSTPRKRTPAQLLLDEIMVTDADKWDGVLAGLSAPGSMTGGVTKEGLLGAIQASAVLFSFLCVGGNMVWRPCVSIYPRSRKSVFFASAESSPAVPVAT